MAERKIRVGKKKHIAPESARASMTPEMIIANVKSLPKLKESEVLDLIDSAQEWDAQQKRLDKMVKAAKPLLLQEAKSGKWKSKAGASAECQIKKSTTSTFGTTTEFVKLLKAEGKISLFDDTVKVQIGQAKKYLGEDALEDFIETDTEEYGSVTLKKL